MALRYGHNLRGFNLNLGCERMAVHGAVFLGFRRQRDRESHPSNAQRWSARCCLVSDGRGRKLVSSVGCTVCQRNRVCPNPGRAVFHRAGRRTGSGLDFGKSVRNSANSFFGGVVRSEEHTSELQSPCNLVCRLLLEKKKKHFVIVTMAYYKCSVHQ